ncbi:MAG: SpoIVB peptidase S55 domain-containing protein, partial [Actinomycetota bacterium]
MSTLRADPPKRFAALFTGVALVGALAITPANSAPTTDCPTVMPVADVVAGMNGTGYTVSKGNTPQPFDAEILGVYPDAILPGRDLIMAEVHSTAIDKVGGVWFGMSGSPVYVTDGGTEKLVGAVAFGF